MQGIDPEIRTYNTVIIACNMSSQAQEALRVYKRMLAVGAQPTATTYTALISAYGKIGQLERALQIFQVCEHLASRHISARSPEQGCRFVAAVPRFLLLTLSSLRQRVITNLPLQRTMLTAKGRWHQPSLG